MRILLLFFDGIGLGVDDKVLNPFAAASLPTLEKLSGGQRWLANAQRQVTDRAVFLPTDACMGIAGKPQSATGQGAIMTGLNVPELIGQHYGPKPNPAIAEIVRRDSVVRKLVENGYTAAMINAYPSQFVDSVKRGKRLLSSNQLAMHTAGVEMFDGQALIEGRAMSADFTGAMWRTHAAYHDAASIVWRTRPDGGDTPILTPYESGVRLAELAKLHDFTFFDCWLTDYIGHRGTIEEAVPLVELIDQVISGLLDAWNDSEGLIIITSDHGNLESIEERGHTRNLVPSVIIGDRREQFSERITDLTGFAPAILNAFGVLGNNG